MGEKEKKKPSSLRTRVDRSRKAYGRKTNPMPLVIGAVFLVLGLIALYIFIGTPEEKKYVPPPESGAGTAETTTGAATASSGSSEQPRLQGTTPKQKAYYLCFYELEDVKAKKKTPEAAISALESGLSAHPDYTPEIYFTMAMAIEKKIARTADTSAHKGLYGEKLDYLEQAQDAVDDGKHWANGTDAMRNGNLTTSIEQAEINARR